MITVKEVLETIGDDPKYRSLRMQLERFSFGTPIKGTQGEGGRSSLSFTPDATAKMVAGEVEITEAT